MESWSELNERRRSICDRWPTIWRLPRVPRSMRFVAQQVRAGERVLDVGASEGRLRKVLPAGAEYHTLDVDPQVEVEYRTFDDVAPGSYDVVTAFEMIEHLTLDDAVRTVAGMFAAVKPGGRAFLSTPNVHHPWAYLRSMTHITPFCYDELGGLLEQAGFAVKALYRCHHDSFVKGLLRRFAHPVYRIVGVDYAKSILVEAHRPRG